MPELNLAYTASPQADAVGLAELEVLSAARLAELEVLGAARLVDLSAPGQVLLRLVVAGFGVALPLAADGATRHMLALTGHRRGATRLGVRVVFLLSNSSVGHAWALYWSGNFF